MSSEVVVKRSSSVRTNASLIDKLLFLNSFGLSLISLLIWGYLNLLAPVKLPVIFIRLVNKLE